MNFEAFTYCWTDHKTNKLYVGYHKGSQDDGYVCSSKWMLEEYNKRPEDFTKMILAEGTAEDCRTLEAVILKAADAMHSDRFYNQSNGDEKFICKRHTETSKSLMSIQRKGKSHWTEERKKNFSVLQAGKSNPNYGKHYTEEEKLTRSISNKKTWGQEEIRKKASISHTGVKLSKEHAKLISISKIGMKWYNNGMLETCCFPGKEPNNWVLGRIKYKRINK